jgi:lipopolysaccharide transport system permease protein
MVSIAKPRPRHDLSRWGSARYIVTHGRLLMRVTVNDVRQRHAGSFLGLGWAAAAPLIVLGIYALIYLEIFKVRVADLTSGEYVLYVFCGLVPYLAAAEAIGLGVSSVITNKSVLNNTVFPIDLAPAKSVMSAQAVMVVGITLILLGVVAEGDAHPTLALLPLVWFMNALWLMGVNWVLSLLTVIFRDLQNLVNAILMVMLVASPIAYTPDMVPATLKPILALNPFAYFVVAYQQVIMLGIWPSTPHLVILIVMTLVTFFFGSWFFDRAKRVIIDYV